MAINFRNIRGFLMQVYLITCLTCLLITILLAIFSPSYKAYIFGLQSMVLAVGMAGIKYKKSVKFLIHLFLVSCYLTLVIYACVTGGLEAPGMVWFMICPLISHITLTKKWAYFWLYLVLGTFLSFMLFKETLIIDSFNGGHAWYFLSFILFLVTVFRLLNIFHKTLHNQSKELNKVNESLHCSQQRIEEQNQQIRLQNHKLEKQRISAIKRSESLEKYLNEMLDISRMEELHGGDLQFTVEVLQNNLLTNLNLDRVSIWEFDSKQSELHLIGSSCATHDIHKPRLKILRKDQYPESFDLLLAGALLNIKDTEFDKYVNELREHIDIEYIFKSLLVCPYFVDGRLAGVISCERLKQRNWSTEDIMFVRAIADTLTLSYKSYERKQQQEQLQEKQQYIQEMNQFLEQKVTSRTEQLKAKNDQLVKYAFMNAHEIRAPICRLLGLNNLLKSTIDPNEIATIKQHMGVSINELDDITIRAGKILEEHMPPEHQDRNYSELV